MNDTSRLGGDLQNWVLHDADVAELRQVAERDLQRLLWKAVPAARAAGFDKTRFVEEATAAWESL